MILLKYVAPCLFGLEGLVSDELKAMGASNVLAENGRVLFEGEQDILARANINSRFAERILIKIGSFKATTFDQLFESVKKLDFENYIGKDDEFPVSGWSLQSKLFSIPDCQKIIKKAIVNRLSAKYKVSWFDETGPRHQIRFSILKDEVTIMLETSGVGLHKRGYRAVGSEAPIKETLAAAMVYLARIYPDTKIYDPFCGSGTILIEAAMQAHNIAPSLKRGFAAERFGFIDQGVFAKEKQRALELVKSAPEFEAFGSDIDSNVLEIAKNNAEIAGVGKSITFERADIKDFALKTERGLVVTNPPYGERLLDIDAAKVLYKTMGEVFERKKGAKYYIITPDEEFETLFGQTADKRRKLYNGNIKCQLYMYFKALS